jgi:hypothetical protein
MTPEEFCEWLKVFIQRTDAIKYEHIMIAFKYKEIKDALSQVRNGQ